MTEKDLLQRITKHHIDLEYHLQQQQKRLKSGLFVYRFAKAMMLWAIIALYLNWYRAAKWDVAIAIIAWVIAQVVKLYASYILVKNTKRILQDDTAEPATSPTGDTSEQWYSDED